MAEVPSPLHSTREAIYQSYVDRNFDQHRPHLGASKIGHACERHLWYTFRWADHEDFEGRMLRLFQSGHLQEPRIVADLRNIGVEVHDVDHTGGQWRVHAVGGHFGGSMDGVAIGFPEAPKTWHVCEFKTSNEKSFKRMLSDGVRKAKPLHYAQMMVYMGLGELDRAMYIMVNKNDDTIYTDRIEFDQVEFLKLIARAERIIKADEPPMRCSQDPSYFECKFCVHSAICHGTRAPEVNCRTCVWSSPVVDELHNGEDGGKWRCDHIGGDAQPEILGLSKQRVGCFGHRFIPILLEKSARPISSTGPCGADILYATTAGQFINGDGTDGTFTSAEIRACGSIADLPTFVEAKKQFPTAKVVG